VTRIPSLHPRQGGLGAIDADHFPGPGQRRLLPEPARVAEQAQDPATGHLPAGPSPVLPLIEEPARLLALVRIHEETGPVLLELRLGWDLPHGGLHIVGESL
jgi:hypothetical protein